MLVSQPVQVAAQLKRRMGVWGVLGILAGSLVGMAFVIAIIAVIASSVDSTTFTLYEDYTCDDLVGDVKGLSREDGFMKPEILKIYSPVEVRDSSYELECEGTAKTSSGDRDVSFYLEKDADGDWFYGYQFKGGLFE